MIGSDHRGPEAGRPLPGTPLFQLIFQIPPRPETAAMVEKKEPRVAAVDELLLKEAEKAFLFALFRACRALDGRPRKQRIAALLVPTVAIWQ